MERESKIWESIPSEIDMTIKADDPRLFFPQCTSLTPVETIHENPWFVVRNRGGYFTTEYRHYQVIILPIVADHSIVMVRVRRPVIDDTVLELPAGNAKEGESPLQTAVREFYEETGIKIDDIRRFRALPPVCSSPNRNPKLLHVYQVCISENEFVSRQPHDKEIIDVMKMSFKEATEMISRGQIYVSIPMAVIGRYLFERMRRSLKGAYEIPEFGAL